ncbi:MAG: hypothetical protein PV344_08925, partial [Anaplasma sp.]|nr:hypothetical protein [Anaplasma sp.]
MIFSCYLEHKILPDNPFKAWRASRVNARSASPALFAFKPRTRARAISRNAQSVELSLLAFNLLAHKVKRSIAMTVFQLYREKLLPGVSNFSLIIIDTFLN